MLDKLRGSILLGLGYMLSPLSWWNDLFFNLPIAYGFAYLFSWGTPDNWFLPLSIVGYWLSNVVGILMMQFGAVDILKKESQERNLKKDILIGLVSSTAYTFLILALIQFGILEAPLISALP